MIPKEGAWISQVPKFMIPDGFGTYNTTNGMSAYFTGSESDTTSSNCGAFCSIIGEFSGNTGIIGDFIK